MFRTSLRNVLSHKLRLVLTVLAITLGVSFVVGTYVFTDSLNKSLAQLFDTEPADVVVQPRNPLSSGGGGAGSSSGGQPGAALTMPDSVVARVASVPGVKSAIGSVEQAGAVVLNSDNQSVGGPTGTPIGVSWEPAQDAGQATVVAGNPPRGDGQVALDTYTAQKANVEVGSVIHLSTPLLTDAQKDWQVTAVVDIGLSGGVTVVLFDLPTAQKYLVGAGKITQVLVTVNQGASDSAVAAAINSEVGPTYHAITGEEAADQQKQAVTNGLGFLNTFLLVFALIAVFVSAFLIFNTFSMLIAQRTREIALLRAVGASRRQVQSGVVIEALVLAFVASTVGIGVGIGFALGLRKLFSVFGIDLPSGSLDIAPRTIVVAYVVGIVVTVAAAWIPARRASNVPPVAAMRTDVTPVRWSLIWRSCLGVSAWVLALLLIWLGLTEGSSNGLAAIGLAAATGIVGTIILLPFLAAPAVKVLGLPFRGWAIGRLAVQNSKRSPRRTAATASALMIGVTLMTIMVVFTSSFTATANQAIDQAYGADYLLGSPPRFQPFDATVFDQVKSIPGIGSATYVQTTEGESGDTSLRAYGTDPALLTQMINFEMVQGSMSAIGDGKVAVDSDTADALGWSVGDTAPAVFRTGRTSVEIVAIYKRVLVYQGFIANYDTLARWGASPDLDAAIYLKLAAGANSDAVRQSVETVLQKYPTVTVQDQAQVKADMQTQINSLLGFVFALLGLSILIAVLGIVNTLLLSVAERTRELGLLRAIGALRSQVRRMVIVEALLLGVFGAVVGVILGVVFGILMQRTMISEGLKSLEIPWPTLIIFLLAGAVAGVLASIWPAFTASRLDVLRAIATE